jgi:hypothetical protein
MALKCSSEKQATAQMEAQVNGQESWHSSHESANLLSELAIVRPVGTQTLRVPSKGLSGLVSTNLKGFRTRRLDRWLLSSSPLATA